MAKAEGAATETGLGAHEPKPYARRSALACLACRLAKNRCDGQAPPLAVELSASQALKAASFDDIPSESPCTRCARLELRCMWQPSHRTGRPRKKCRVLDASSLNQNHYIGSECLPYPINHPSDVSTCSSNPADVLHSAGSVPPSHAAAFDLTDRDLFALLNVSAYDSTESSLRSLEDVVLDQDDPVLAFSTEPLQPALMASRVACGIADFDGAETPGTSVARSPAGAPIAGALLDPEASALQIASAQSSPCAREQFAKLRSRIGTYSAHGGLEVDKRPLDLWPASRTDFQGQETELQRGLRLYFGNFGVSVPILGEEEKFFAASFVEMPELSPSPLVLYAAATLGLLLQDGKDALTTNAMRSEARELADGIVNSPAALSDMDQTRVLSAIQGLILVAYDDYGRLQLPAAARYLKTAGELALRSQLNLLDSGRTSSQSQAGREPSPSSSPVSFAGIGVNQCFTPDFLQDCRRTWWELYIADLMFHMVTSAEFSRTFTDRQMVVAVDSPTDPGETPSRSEAYDVRIRAAALINECTRAPVDPANPDLDRLRAIDTMLNNLLLRGQSMWADIAAKASSLLGRARPSVVVGTKLEILFTAMVVLHAARIHLHRQAWFSDLQMDLESCSFKPKSGAVERLSAKHGANVPPGLTEEARRIGIAESVSAIVSNADGIRRMVRLDAEMHLDLTTLRPPAPGLPPPTSRPVPPHWPFFTCCSMVASFGYAVAVAASGSDYSALPTYKDEIRMRSNEEAKAASPAESVSTTGSLSIRGADEPTMESIIVNWNTGPDSQSDATFGSGAYSHVREEYGPSSSSSRWSDALDGMARRQQPQRDAEACIWKTRAALSNICFAETTLSLYATVWPVAGMYQAEVQKCKKAVDFSGPTGLGS